MLRRSFLHTVLFSLAPILTMFSHNAFRASWSDLVLPTGGSIIFALVITALFWVVTRDGRKAFLVSSLALALCFSFGHIAQALRDWPIGRPTFMLPLWFAMFAVGAIALIRTKQDLSRLTAIVNVVAIAAFTMPVVSVGIYEAKSRIDTEQVNCTEPLREAGRAVVDPMPDIYYIILDRYGSAATLESAFGFDNDEFTSALESRDFYVADRSISNYILTVQSLTSSLNMDYINCMTAALGSESIDRRPLLTMFLDYRVWRFLKNQGYSFVHVGNDKHFASRNPYADKNINHQTMPEFTRMVLESTVLWPVINKLSLIDDRREEKAKRVHHNFRGIADMAKESGPTFLFAHFLMPHPPFVFDADGRYLTQEQEDARTRPENFEAQVHYTNKLVLELVDGLIAASDVPPVIILQGDEGPYPPGSQTETYDWTGASPKGLAEKVGILNALYMPGVSKDTFHPDMTPVNTFRIIFNHYFGTDYELLPDRSFASTSQRKVYDFFEITDVVK